MVFKVSKKVIIIIMNFINVDSIEQRIKLKSKFPTQFFFKIRIDYEKLG